MDDLISRQAAIDALGRIGSLDTYADREYATEIFMNLPSAQPEPLTVNFAGETDREVIEKLKESSKNAPVLIMAANDSAQPQWIPCSDRLPEKNGEYLVTRWTGYLQKGLVIDIAKYYEGEWKKAFPVDAWMPLPEPWKGEQP